MADEFDVFLSHNSRDKPAVKEVAALLRDRGLRVWLDKDELRPGFPWQEGLEAGVQASRSVAVFVGKDGMGAWQTPEMRAFLARARREEIPVIPVLLPGCPEPPQLNLFLEARSWVDLRQGLTDDVLDRLVWGITGTKSDGPEAAPAATPRTSERPSRSSRSKTPRRWWSWGIALSLLGVLLTLAAWLWLRFPEASPPAKPEIYAVRVQVLDPHGRPVEGATIRASAGNEPQRLPDGWWEVEIPAAKVPTGGRISLWAEHEWWEGNRVDLRLGVDPNSQVEIRLKEPVSWLLGRVVDESDQPLSGVRLSRQDGAPGEAMTDAEGRFALKLSVPRETRVRLRAEYKNSPPGDEFCYVGRNSCWIVLEKR